jgi:hypothetical protein
MQTILYSITTTVLSGLLLFFIKEYIRLIKKASQEKKETSMNEDELLLGVARILLIEKMQLALDRGYTTQTEYEVIDELYKPYIKCGGNGVVKHLFEDRYNGLKVKHHESGLL